ncbi:DUF192 domain-containing protein [Curvivirga aplysinae]|uniref:DUF192 domain-containing protein n=1 Tax=Curvivirga aplysinae TaxID=2529852 RepID=UPI0012BC2191|nr:DUF192 domain-containing protein [Curvivirga aplysinae]MTI09284.1 DUF192 domain-containing protein [Curvivirga aplysinae]
MTNMSFAGGVTFGRDTVIIKTNNGPVSFEMEIASDYEQRKQGLMFRTELADGKGMLFDYGFPYEAAMWMKNTLIPLDMLFVRSDGKITYIHHRAVPGDLTAISAGEPVRAVIELAGGQAKAKKIKVGDYVDYKIFTNRP